MFDKARDQMNNWRWDNPRAFWDQVNSTNPQTTSSGKAKRTGKPLSWYSSDNLRAMIELPSCRQYKPRDFLAIKSLNWDQITDKDNDDENWADPGAPSGGRSHPGDGNDNEDGEGDEDMQGGEKGTGKGKGIKDGKGQGKGKGKAIDKGKGKGKGNDKRKGIVKETPGGDDISRAVASQLRKDTYEADQDTENKLEPE